MLKVCLGRPALLSGASREEKWVVEANRSLINNLSRISSKTCLNRLNSKSLNLYQLPPHSLLHHSSQADLKCRTTSLNDQMTRRTLRRSRRKPHWLYYSSSSTLDAPKRGARTKTTVLLQIQQSDCQTGQRRSHMRLDS